MSDKTGIEWCHTKNPDGSVTPGATWNPLRAKNLETGRTGWHCERVSSGCGKGYGDEQEGGCYSEDTNRGFFQLGTKLPFTRQSRDKVEIFLDKKTLEQPLRWTRPRKIFVCSMTDLFGEFHTDEMIDEVFALIGACNDADRDHIFIILTKRHKRMLEYMKSRARKAWNSRRMNRSAFPPRNIWLGVSCEDQKAADERIPALLEAPAAVRFISAEPLLGEIDFSKWFPHEYISKNGFDYATARYRDGESELEPPCRICGEMTNALHWVAQSKSLIDQVITGGESGCRARVTHPNWFRKIRDACLAAGVAYFHKQNGEYLPVIETQGEIHYVATSLSNTSPVPKRAPFFDFPDGQRMIRVGKKAAGRLLDGKEWSEFPKV